MRRIMVVGSSGAGKTTMAMALAERFELTHIELDELYHLAGWTPRERSDFRRAVAEAMARASDGWVMCGDYDSAIGELRLAAADTVVWLDYSRLVVTRRVVLRTLRRAITREELWNGNREPLANFYRWDPERNVIRWSWTHFREKRSRYERSLAGDWATLNVFRFTTPRSAAAWLGSLPQLG
ncbi:MAG: hypothetical protein R2706_14090 [Acidimicrobiales bacterium]